MGRLPGRWCPVSRLSAGLIVLAGLLALLGPCPGARADDSPRGKRAVYFLKHASARDLAAALAKHFKGEAEAQAAPVAADDCLLVRAEPRVLEEVAKLVTSLDRRPRQIVVDLLIVELPAKAGADSPGEK